MLRSGRAIGLGIVVVASLLTVARLSWSLEPPARRDDAASTRSTDSVKIVLHDKGKTTTIAEPGLIEELRATCETALTSVEQGQMLQRLVVPGTIENVKANALSVEVVYAAPRHVNLVNLPSKNPNHSLIINRLLVQLAAPAVPAADRTVTVFYEIAPASDAYAYASGPYSNSGKFDTSIRTKLRLNGYLPP